jgi:hypothetical protein
MGSPVYMSPEQIRGSDDVDCRTDIWSLGCVLYELLTGVAAFDAPSLTQLSATILEKDPVSMADLAPEVPRELISVVMRCLDKDAGKRFQNIAQLAMALYPFGPRRARVSAERCAFLLEGAEGAAKFDLASVHPPPNSSDNVVSGAPTSQDHPRTTTPAAISVREPTPMPDLRRGGRWVGAVSILVATLGVGGYALTRAAAPRAFSPVDGVANRSAAIGAARPPTPAPRPATALEAPSPTTEGDQVPANAPSAAAIAAAPPASATAKPLRGPVHVLAKPKRTVAATPTDRKSSGAHTSDDTDVGF